MCLGNTERETRKVDSGTMRRGFIKRGAAFEVGSEGWVGYSQASNGET